MNVEIGTEAPIFLFWEYLFQIFGILSLQCTKNTTQIQIERVVKTILKKADYLNNFLNFLLRLLGDRIVRSAAQVLANLNTQFLLKLIRKRGLGNCRHLPQGFLPKRRRQPREGAGKEFFPDLITQFYSAILLLCQLS
jgi:hypothetical protein